MYIVVYIYPTCKLNISNINTNKYKYIYIYSFIYLLSLLWGKVCAYKEGYWPK
jgi:hypothetical protein